MQHADGRLNHLVLLRVNDDGNLTMEKRFEVLQSQVEFRLLGFAFEESVILANVVLAFHQLLTNNVVHSHAARARFATASLGVSCLGDFQNARSTDDDVFRLAGSGFHQHAEATHIGSAARDVANRCHTASDGNLELIVVRNDLIPVPQFGIGLVNHFVQVTRSADMAVSFDQARHGELIRMIDHFVVLGDFDFFPRTDSFDFSILNQNRSITNRIASAGEDFPDVKRDSCWFFFVGFIGRQHRRRNQAQQ